MFRNKEKNTEDFLHCKHEYQLGREKPPYVKKIKKKTTLLPFYRECFIALLPFHQNIPYAIKKSSNKLGERVAAVIDNRLFAESIRDS